MALNFPSSPVDGQIYYDSSSGNRYVYDATATKWKYAANNDPYTGVSNTQILYNNQNAIDGSPGLTFSSNTLYTNTVNVSGYIYGNGAFLTGVASDLSPAFNTANAAFDKANTVNTFAYGVAVNAAAAFNAANNAVTDFSPAFNKANGAYVVANAAFDKANAVVTISATAPVSPTVGALWWDESNATMYVYYNDGDSSQWVPATPENDADWATIVNIYNITNTAFDVANAAYGSANNVAPQVAPAFNTANAAFGVANAAFDSANNVAPQIAPAFNTANAAYSYANASNTWANTTFVKLVAGQQTITGDLAIAGNLSLLGSSTTISSNSLSVGDSLIYLAANNYSGTDFLDIGFIANYGNTNGSNVHTGLIRDATDKQYYLFQAYDTEPANNTFVPGSNNMVNAVLVADLNTSNLTLGGTNAITWITTSYGTANLAYTISNAAFSYANSKGYYAGNNGDKGNATGLGDIFRVHSNTLTQNVTIYSGNNALAAGPITVSGTSTTLTIQTGARLAIV